MYVLRAQHCTEVVPFVIIGQFWTWFVLFLSFGIISKNKTFILKTLQF